MTEGILIALDPGNVLTGYVVCQHDGNDIVKIIDKGKLANAKIFDVLSAYKGYDFAIEMIAGMGMAVGAEVFDTCVWIGRYWQYVAGKKLAKTMEKVYRREEKLCICGQPTAKDANIRQALIDRYAPGASNYGKGTKKEPGFFYGMAADAWMAFAVAVTWADRELKGVQIIAKKR